MNYAKIYNKMCSYYKETTPIERLLKRDKTDPRIHDTSLLYTEKHHIIPRHEGGDDSIDNIVEVLFEEHFLLHLVRYKAYGNRKDFLACRFIINGMKKNDLIKINLPENSSMLKRIGLFKSMIQKFRKECGWQSKRGLESISKARTGKIPAICTKTNKIIEVSLDDPRVLSGELKHHSYGKVSVTNRITNERLYIDKHEYRENKHIYTWNGPERDMENNGRFCGLSDETILNYAKEYYNSIEDKSEFSFGAMKRYLTEKYGAPKRYSKNRFKKFGGFEKAFSNVVGVDLDTLMKQSRSKSKTHRENLSKANRDRKWYHNNKLKINKQLFDHEVTNDWHKGRKKWD